SAIFGIDRHLRSRCWLGEKYRRQPLASIDGGLVGTAPRFEELHQLLARAVIVPFAIALDDFKQLIGRLGAVALGVERGGEVESRLMVQRVRSELLLQLGH